VRSRRRSGGSPGAGRAVEARHERVRSGGDQRAASEIDRAEEASTEMDRPASAEREREWVHAGRAREALAPEVVARRAQAHEVGIGAGSDQRPATEVDGAGEGAGDDQLSVGVAGPPPKSTVGSPG
jgi:hypothetical protein